MLEQMTLPGIEAVIGLPGLADGPSRSEWQDGPTIGQSGQDRALVSPSRSQAKATECQTSATFGPVGSTSFESAALALFLVNRLKQQSDIVGSTLFKLTWKQVATPSRRSVYLLRASVRRTSDSDCGSWPTPLSSDQHKRGSGTAKNGLMGFANLASWPTPVSNDAKGSTHCYSRGDKTKPALKLPGVAMLAGWPTPNSQLIDAKPNPPIMQGRKPTDPQIGLACVATHIATPCRLTASGEMLTGLDAAMESGGQLNPALACWLQGYPKEWCDYVDMETR